MKLRNIFILIALSLITWFAMQSCRTKKEVMSATSLSSKVNAEIFTDVIENQLEYSTFSSKINLNLSSGKKSISSKSSIKIQKDKAIQLSIQPLFGVEMLRLHIDLDTLVILDRMNKRYVKESIADIKDEYPVGFDYSTLQSLLTNQFFVSGNNSVSYTDYNRFSSNQISDKYYLLASTDKKSGIEYSFAIDGNDHIASTQLREPKKNYELEWTYDEFIKSNHNAFPHKMNIIIATPKRKANVGMEFSGITINENLDLGMSIPKSYSRTSISDIIKILTSIR